MNTSTEGALSVSESASIWCKVVTVTFRLSPFDVSPLMTTDARRLVTQILGELAERNRKLLRLVFLEKRDSEEVYRELARDREYMRVPIHRAKSRLNYSIRIS
jgi:DNA-directed RNA polymerase specialized sigma24 family protein